MVQRIVATILMVGCLAAGLSACGSGEQTTTRISFLPSTPAKGSTWTWSSACRAAPHAPSGCAAAGPDLAGHAQLAGNEWNLGSAASTAATDGVSMSVSSSGGLQLRGDLSSAPPCTDGSCIAPQANTWVRGYPSVLYGIDQCNAATSPRPSTTLRLPASVASIPDDLVGGTAYESQASQVTYDVAYDLWLNGVPNDEVMIWTDNHGQYPAGSRFAANVSLSGHTWDVYATSGNGYLAFVPSGGARLTSGALDIKAMLTYLVGQGRVAASSTVDQVCYGVEIVDTGGAPATWHFTNFSITDS